MPKRSMAKSLLATVSGSTSAASCRAVTPSSSQTSTTLSSFLLSSLDRPGSKDKSRSPLSGKFAAEVSTEISVLLHDCGTVEESTSNSSPEIASQALVNNFFGIEWNSNPSTAQNEHRKAMTREGKKRYFFRNTKSGRYTKLMEMCAKRLGTTSTVEFFTKLRRESSTKDYHALIGHYTSEARMSQDEDEAFDHILDAHYLLLLMKGRGFVIEEASYGPILSYLVDFKMVQQFDELCGFLKEENPRALSRLGYYEMLLCIRVSDEERINELCESFSMASVDGPYSLAGTLFYLLVGFYKLVEV